MIALARHHIVSRHLMNLRVFTLISPSTARYLNLFVLNGTSKAPLLFPSKEGKRGEIESRG